MNWPLPNYPWKWQIVTQMCLSHHRANRSGREYRQKEYPLFVSSLRQERYQNVTYAVYAVSALPLTIRVVMAEVPKATDFQNPLTTPQNCCDYITLSLPTMQDKTLICTYCTITCYLFLDKIAVATQKISLYASSRA